MPYASVTCDLAGIRFHLSPARAQQFNESCAPFLNLGDFCADNCRVRLAGVLPELDSLRLTGAWHFSMRDGEATIMGANTAGQALWRMVGRHPYEELVFGWHVSAFEALYGDFKFGMFNIALVLALMLRLLPLGGLTLHGSAQSVDGRGIICTGSSGRGKSTISGLFNAAGFPVLTDERLMLRPVEGGYFRVYGSPWPSSGGFVRNASAPLRKIYFLEHGPRQEILPLTRREALFKLLEVTLVPWLDHAFFDPFIPIVERLLAEVPYALLRFRPDSSVVEVVRRDLASCRHIAGG